jgi:hypothetical protein
MLNFNINTDQAFYYRKAIRFDVYKLKNKKLKESINKIVNEVIEIYKSKAIRIRGLKERKHACFYILLNLWKANYLTLNPWVSYSKDKNKYRKGERLNKLHFKYEAFIQTLQTLSELNFIIDKKGVNYDNYPFTSRMKASEKLIKVFDTFNINNQVASIKPSKPKNLIILKDVNKVKLDYRANKTIKKWRENLTIINNKINDSCISLDMEDEQYHELIMELNSNRDRVDFFPDFTANTLHRVFNNASFKQGGRFYGGWWQSIPREFRKFIYINHKNTEEIDYSGHHLRILYSINNKELAGHPYRLIDEKQNTADKIQDRKEATLIMLNCKTEIQAFHTIKKEGIKNARQVMNEILERHHPIHNQFFTGIGNQLMFEDSLIAEQVMLEMIKLGHTILPVHDSFIVRNTAASELKIIMEKSFNDFYSNAAKVDTKETILQWINKKESKETFVEMNLEKLLKNKTIFHSIW